MKEKKTVTILVGNDLVAHTDCGTMVKNWEYTVTNDTIYGAIVYSIYCPTCKVNIFHFQPGCRAIFETIYELPI